MRYPSSQEMKMRKYWSTRPSVIYQKLKPRGVKGHTTSITGNFVSHSDGDPVRANLRAQQTLRNRRVKITLAPMPWDGEKK